jgi:hypothetical protein
VLPERKEEENAPEVMGAKEGEDHQLGDLQGVLLDLDSSLECALFEEVGDMGYLPSSQEFVDPEYGKSLVNTELPGRNFSCEQNYLKRKRGDQIDHKMFLEAVTLEDLELLDYEVLLVVESEEEHSDDDIAAENQIANVIQDHGIDSDFVVLLADRNVIGVVVVVFSMVVHERNSEGDDKKVVS